MKHKHINLTFDETYNKQKEFFGHPYQELQKYFQKYPIKGKLLDLGSGQGRDSIYLASIGYRVTAVDSSKVGITQMEKKARERNLKIKAIVEDVLRIHLEERFDIILMDMLLHTLKKDNQIKLLKKFSDNLKINGVFCIVFPDDLNSSYFLKLLNSLSNKWKIIDEIIIRDVPKFQEEKDKEFTFKMIVVMITN